MISDLAALIAQCKCAHVWFIRKKIPIYCPKCHRRTMEHSAFYSLWERIDDSKPIPKKPTRTIPHPLVYGCSPGDLLEDVLARELPADWNIPKQEKKEGK